MGSVIITTACQDESPTTGPSARPDLPDLQQVPVSADPLLAHARAIPGFGGFFLDRNGRPTVYLKDASQRRSAGVALSGTLRQLGASSSQLQVLQADYDYLQLNDWFTRAGPEALAVPGVVFADLDEGSNRLRLGVETGQADREVRGVLSRLAIPSAAVVVELTRTHPLRRHTARQGDSQTWRSSDQRRWRHLHAGFQYPRVERPAQLPQFHPASRTNVQGGVESTQFHQPFASNPIGREVADPVYFTGFPALRVEGAASVTRRVPGISPPRIPT